MDGTRGRPSEHLIGRERLALRVLKPVGGQRVDARRDPVKALDVGLDDLSRGQLALADRAGEIDR
jgi:hypothetical protein